MRFLLALKTMLVMMLIAVSAIGAVVYTTYIESEKELHTHVADMIVAIANSSAATLPLNRHENIFYDPDSGLDGQEDFDFLQAMLARIRDANALSHHEFVSPIYTLRKTWGFDESRQLSFVVMSNPSENGQFYSGALIEAQDWHSQVFDGGHYVSGVYTDPKAFG